MSLETRHGKTLEEMEEPTKIDTKGVIVTIATIRPTTEQPIEKFTPGWRLLCAFTSIAIVNLVCALDATIVVVALPAITIALHGDAIKAFWTGTSFLLASTVWQPNFVAFSRNWGRRLLLLLTMLVFTVGSIVCAVSYNFTMMLAGRSVQGSGSGGILAMTQILITDMVPLRERAKYFSLINIVWATGGVSGPLIGGALASANAWRWIFYLNLPIVAVGFIGIIAFLKLRNTCRTLREKLLEVDYIDSIIHLPSLTSFLMGVTWAGVQYAWDSWPTVVPISVGAFGLIVFAFWEAIGVAIGGVIFQDRMVTNLSRHPELSASATSNSQDVMGMIQWVNMTPASDPRKHVVAVSLSESIGSMWVIMCGLGGLALISTIFLDAYSLNQAIATEQRFLGQHLKEKVENP